MKKKTKILIIEDDVNLRQLYQEILSQNGFEVELAADGEVGLQKLQQGGHDLTLLDVMLPKLSGIEILQALKDRPVAKEKPTNGIIVLMTNMSQEAVIQKAEELGSTAHINKSEITPGILVAHVQKLLAT